MNIELFIEKMDALARKQVMVLVYDRAPLSELAPLWRLVHREDRTSLPALPELSNVLGEMKIDPDLEMFEAMSPKAAGSQEQPPGPPRSGIRRLPSRCAGSVGDNGGKPPWR